MKEKITGWSQKCSSRRISQVPRWRHFSKSLTSMRRIIFVQFQHYVFWSAAWVKSKIPSDVENKTIKVTGKLEGNFCVFFPTKKNSRVKSLQTAKQLPGDLFGVQSVYRWFRQSKNFPSFCFFCCWRGHLRHCFWSPEIHGLGQSTQSANCFKNVPTTTPLVFSVVEVDGHYHHQHAKQ